MRIIPLVALFLSATLTSSAWAAAMASSSELQNGIDANLNNADQVAQATPAAITITETVINANLDNSAVAIEQVQKPKKRHVSLLPGIGKLTLSTKLTHSSVIRTTGDGTEAVLISSRFPNRIATPFDIPRVIGKTSAEIVKDGTSLFISSPKEEGPFVIFVTGSNAGDPVISLTLISKDIPSQTLQLQLDSAQGAVRKAPKVEGYTQQVVELLRQVAIGKAPEGFSEGVMPNFIAKEVKHGLTIMPMMRYSGSTFDIYKYKVENNQAKVELSESSFYQRGVRAVSIFPNVLLGKGESTNVYVLADKSILDGDDNGR